ncbi:hypothetical protein [Deinococcus multiflagellatus]|uniref:Uncharacterized protein n=1 Tax=Deinococcus multiflagellatus TaxID=1656887 RepID=A0ABW1ZNY5_9DEIO
MIAPAGRSPRIREPGRRELTAQQHQRETQLYRLEYLLQVAWVLMRLILVVAPVVFLAAWCFEVYQAFKVGGPHITLAAIGFGILVLLGAVTTSVERMRSARAARRLLTQHQRRW